MIESNIVSLLSGNFDYRVSLIKLKNLENRKRGILNKQSLIQFRVDQDCKQEVDDICEQLGIDLTTVLKMCLKQMIIQKGIPFSVHLPDDGEKYHSDFNVNDVQRQGIDKKSDKDFKMDLKRINEEVDSIRRENRI